MPKIHLTWSFGGKDKVIYVKDSIKNNKFFVGDYGFKEEDYLKRKKEADSEGEKITGHNYLAVSWEDEIKDVSNIEQDSKKILDILLKFFMLNTDIVLDAGGITYKTIESDGTESPLTLSFTSVITENPLPEEVDKTKFEKSLELYDKFLMIDENDKQPNVLRAIDWYLRGLQEHDKINAYANYWIGFESLTFMFGDGPPTNCKKCGHLICKHSINKRMKEFLNALKLTSKWETELERLYQIRNKLFHESEEFHFDDVAKLRNMLKDSITATIRIFGIC